MRNTNGFEITALVLGIVSIPLSCLHATLGLIAAIVGIVMAVKARRSGGTAMATAGLICAIVGCVFGGLNLLGGLLLVILALTV